MEHVQGFEADGTPLNSTAKDELQVYEQLAQVTTQLWRLRFPKIGPMYQKASGQSYFCPFVDEQGNSFGPFDTAVELSNSKWMAFFVHSTTG